MSENVAGVTILAFGNGAPDLFTAFAGAEFGHPEILYSGMTGSALFVTTLIAGLVIWCRPFRINGWPLITNTVFLIAAYSILFLAFYNRHYTYHHCIAALVVYIVYIIITIVFSIVEKYEKSGDTIEKEENELTQIANNQSVYLPPAARHKISVTIEILKQMERNKVYREMGFRPSSYRPVGYRWTNVSALIEEFVSSMKTIKFDDWEESSKTEKFFLVLNCVNQFWLKLILPVVNPELPRDNWCKLLIMINMVVLPIFSMFSVNMLQVDIYGLPAWCFCLVIGLSAAVIVFFTTKTYRQPKHHYIFSFIGFIGSILMIRILANEVIIHLQTLGAKFNLSNVLLSLSCLSFGNSLGDLVINYGLAKQGMQNMGFAACFGGPMFNISFGSAITAICILLQGHTFGDFYGELSPGASLYLYISLGSTLIFITLMNFEGRPFYGFYLIVLYCVYFLFIILMETAVHPMGTQHFRKVEIEKEDDW